MLVYCLLPTYFAIIIITQRDLKELTGIVKEYGIVLLTNSQFRNYEIIVDDLCDADNNCKFCLKRRRRELLIITTGIRALALTW